MALLRGTIDDWDDPTFTATVRLDGSAPQTVDGVRTSVAIDTADMTAGRRVIIDTGETGELEEWVILATWDP